MERLKALNKKAVKKIIEKLHEQFGYDSQELLEYAFFLKEKDNSIKIVNPDVAQIMDKKVNIDKMGLKLGKEISDGLLLTIEGSQLLGPSCSKGVINLDQMQVKAWLKGEDIEFKGDDGFVILKYNYDFVGSGKLKAGKVINNVPKPRRQKEII